MDNPDPGELLRAWRGKRSLREIGEILKCDASYVRYLERLERTPPTLTVALKIEELVGISPRAWPTEPKKREPKAADSDADAVEHDASEPAA